MPDTNNTHIPEDTKIHSLSIDHAYKDEALETVRNLVRGNKYNPDHVKLEKFEGEVLQFKAENMLTVLRKDLHKKVSGRTEGPIVVDNETALKEAMTKAYLALHTDRDLERRIRDIVLKRDDKGFGIDKLIIPLPFWKKEYVIYEPCLTCHTQGSTKCIPCSGKGTELCTRCNGSGMSACNHCRGAQMVQAQNGQKIQCPVCNGQGRTSCAGCNQTGKIQCKICRGKGITTCPNCNGNAWVSEIHTMEIEVRTAFDYPRKRLPDKIVLMIEKYGAKIKEHAKIVIDDMDVSVVNADDEEKAKNLAVSDQRKDLRIPIIYDVSIPYAHIEYNISGKSYYTFLFGTQKQLSHVSPFLDDLLKNGIRKLQDAAENRGDVIENLKQAVEYKTVKQGIFYAARHSVSKAQKALKQSNLMGLSDQAIKDIISHSDRALKNITKKPRLIATIFAAFLHTVLLGGFFLTPLRGIIASLLPNTQIEMGIDLGMLFLTLYIGVLIIQSLSQNALYKALSEITSGKITKAVPPKLGKTGYWNAGTAFIIFIVALELSNSVTMNAPHWYYMLRH